MVARIGARDSDLPPPRPGGTLEELRCLAGYRRELVKSRTAHINRLHADLTQIRCGYHRTGAALTSAKGLQRVARLLAGDSAAPARVARGRLRQIRELNRQIADLAAEISELVSANGTTLTKIRGIGTIGAADILTEVGDPARFATKARFAMANGTAPLQASSGRTVRHRLNRGGNRQLNRAIHTAALTQIAQPNSEGRRLYQQHLDRGKTKREAIRALKRRISDRIWTHLQTDLRNTMSHPRLDIEAHTMGLVMVRPPLAVAHHEVGREEPAMSDRGPGRLQTLQQRIEQLEFTLGQRPVGVAELAVTVRRLAKAPAHEGVGSRDAGSQTSQHLCWGSLSQQRQFPSYRGPSLRAWVVVGDSQDATHDAVRRVREWGRSAREAAAGRCRAARAWSRRRA